MLITITGRRNNTSVSEAGRKLTGFIVNLNTDSNER